MRPSSPKNPVYWKPSWKSIPITPISWKPSWKLIPAKYPQVSIFEYVARPEDLENVVRLFKRTSKHLVETAGNFSLIPPEEMIVGPGSTAIMTAFTHLKSEGGRFSDGTFGVYYAAFHIDTAIEETKFHQEDWLKKTGQDAMIIEMRCYEADLIADLHDIRKMQHKLPFVYATDPGAYNVAQTLSSVLKQKESNGIAYDSVRHPGGECAAVFRPRVLSPAKEGPLYCYVWDGKTISQTYKKILDLN